MQNFDYMTPTRLVFGENAIEKLPAVMAAIGKRVLLTYGGGSIKKIGLYDRVKELLKDFEITELSGIQPNPKYDPSVLEGVRLCKENNIDVILSVGGGSVLDCSKAIAGSAKYDGDPWDIITAKVPTTAAIPIVDILTLAATGSEYDCGGVISRTETNDKLAYFSPLVFPVCSILDPCYTFSVSKKQTAAGTADMISHTFENYFSFETGADVQKRFGEGLLKVMFHYGPIALHEPDNYDARANLMLAATHAINGLTRVGNAPAWCVHPMEHELSAFYDITHGQGLAILTPVWMEHVLSEKTAPIFAAYGRNVWGISDDDDMSASKKAIEKTREFFFTTMELPKNLREVGITEQTHFEKMAEKAAAGCVGCFVPLSKDDIIEIFKAAF